MLTPPLVLTYVTPSSTSPCTHLTLASLPPPARLHGGGQASTPSCISRAHVLTVHCARARACTSHPSTGRVLHVRPRCTLTQLHAMVPQHMATCARQSDRLVSSTARSKNSRCWMDHWPWHTWLAWGVGGQACTTAEPWVTRGGRWGWQAGKPALVPPRTALLRAGMAPTTTRRRNGGSTSPRRRRPRPWSAANGDVGWGMFAL